MQVQHACISTRRLYNALARVHPVKKPACEPNKRHGSCLRSAGIFFAVVLPAAVIGYYLQFNPPTFGTIDLIYFAKCSVYLLLGCITLNVFSYTNWHFCSP